VNIPRILGFSLLLTTSLAVSVEGAKETHQPIAIVYSLTGEASLAVPGAARRPVRLFDRLTAGTAVEVGQGARVALAFVNGKRYVLGEGSRVTLGAQDLASRSGSLRTLPQIPPLPCLLPIAPEDRPGPRAGAVRIRGERIMGLYPRRGATALAGETVLHFEPIAASGEYRIEVQDRQGRTVFRTDTESQIVKVPVGTLRPGLAYLWTVRTLDRPGSVARGEATLVTLDAEASRAREEARKVLAAEGSDSLPLLAEIDRSLGLLLEALQELQVAHDRSPGNAPLAHELAALEKQLENGDEPHL
jgi:hypothetical protein